MNTIPDIRSAKPSDVHRVAAVIADAFADLNATAYLVPDPEHRVSVLTQNFEILVEHALVFGRIRVLDDMSAAAVWLDHTRPVPPPPDYQTRLAAATGPYLQNFNLLDHLFELNHPLPPHHYLAFLAVQPNHQRKGYGSALLDDHHAIMDELGVPAYLEASDNGSEKLYLQHGYFPGRPFRMPNAATFTPMLRPGTVRDTSQFAPRFQARPASPTAWGRHG